MTKVGRAAIEDLKALGHEWGWVQVTVILPVGIVMWVIETFVTTPPVDTIYASHGRRTGLWAVLGGQAWTILTYLGLA
jgi:hypothetical protein